MASNNQPSIKQGSEMLESDILQYLMMDSRAKTNVLSSDSNKDSPVKAVPHDGMSKLDGRVYIDFSLVRDQEVEYEKPLLGNIVHNLFSDASTKGVVPNDFDLTVDTQIVSFMGRQQRHRGKIFPVRLYEILSYGSQVEHIISWLPHGRSFIVRDPGLFTDEIIPRFFKPTQYKSFIRQLSLWGFKRIVRGPDSGSYYHQLFLRSKPGILIKMVNKNDKVIETYTPTNAEGKKVAKSVVLDANMDRKMENNAPPLFYALAEKRPLPNLSIRMDPLPPLNGQNGRSTSISAMSVDAFPNLNPIPYGAYPNGMPNSFDYHMLQQRQLPPNYHHQAPMPSRHMVPPVHAPVRPASHLAPPPMNATYHDYAGIHDTRSNYGNTSHREVMTDNFDFDIDDFPDVTHNNGGRRSGISQFYNPHAMNYDMDSNLSHRQNVIPSVDPPNRSSYFERPFHHHVDSARRTHRGIMEQCLLNVAGDMYPNESSLNQSRYPSMYSSGTRGEYNVFNSDSF